LSSQLDRLQLWLINCQSRQSQPETFWSR